MHHFRTWLISARLMYLTLPLLIQIEVSAQLMRRCCVKVPQDREGGILVAERKCTRNVQGPPAVA